MKLKVLIKDMPLTVFGSKEVEITGITSNSKNVAPGNLFIAKRGRKYDGARFIPDALAAGAASILSDVYDPFLEGVTQLIHHDIELAERKIASHYYRYPDKALCLVGITGTNGKTTSSYLVRHLLKECGLIGTIEWIVGSHVLPSTQTTPDLVTNYKLLHDMKESGNKAAVMEVSSHALDQGRVRGLDFDAAIFTQLTRDHLDYHENMEKYADAKALLFASLPSDKLAIFNADSEASLRMKRDCRAKQVTYGLDTPADVMATDLELKAEATRFTLRFQGKSVRCTTSLIGRFNVYNCLAAAALVLSRGQTLEQVAEGLKTFKAVPGRLERVRNEKNLSIFVDYAHTDDALKNVLETLKEAARGRLITVFGCGGDRDQTKRPKMGAVAEQFSDITIITSDNPRTESPDAIIRDILAGIKNQASCIIEPDREEAIRRAVKMAREDDIVLIAGKGHEQYQIFAHQTLPFDDRIVAAQCSSKTRGQALAEKSGDESPHSIPSQTL